MTKTTKKTANLPSPRDDEAQHFCSGDLLREYDKKKIGEKFFYDLLAKEFFALN
jgi:hypothetical protein